MVKKTYNKTVLKMFRSNISRLIAVTLIVFVGIAFVTGVGTLSGLMSDSIQEYYKECNGADIILKSTSPFGFTKDDIDKVKNTEGVENIRTLTSFDIDDVRYIIVDMNENSVHSLTIKEGEKISSQNEILVDQISEDVNIGQMLTLLGSEYTVVGKVSNPSYMSKEPEPSSSGSELKYICYLDKAFFSNPAASVITDIYVKINCSEDLFSESYKELVDEMKDRLVTDDTVVALTLEENVTYKYTEKFSEKIDFVAAVFPAFFVLVSCLVVYSTMTRLLEEERPIIGCYRTLGVSGFAIVIKYLIFSFTGCVIGSALGLGIGVWIFPSVIYPAFEASYFMPDMTATREILPGIIASAITLAFILTITLIMSIKLVRTRPCELLRAKSPKAGRKILLERIPIIWKHLAFRYKSAVRNICRYISHTVMTVISVAGSTLLVFAGLGLYSVAVNPNTEEIPPSMGGTFAGIASVIVIFAIALSVLIIFNLINMNIQERHREIATLRVLGYQNTDVAMYIYREIFITSVLGLIIGLPSGVGFLQFFFDFLEFGAVRNVEWYYYIITVALMLVSVVTVSFLLYRKIIKIDMNSSLKNVE